MELDPDLPGPWVADPLSEPVVVPPEGDTRTGVTAAPTGPCDDCRKAQLANTLIGMGIGVAVGAAALYILTRPKA